MAENTNTSQSQLYPPVVAVLGHVDHGKTTLLDAIRKTSIAEREHGGITQKIGASTVEIMHEGKPARITFIDTPGHEAFSKMRSRGAQAADIGLLIVSAVDSVMPQTRESIQVLKHSGIPYIVVLTKADLPTKNSEKVKQQLMAENVVLEGYGGDIPVIEVSAKTNMNVKELLDLILLVQELHQEEQQAVSPEAPLRAIVIESRLDQKSGPRATVIVKNGTLTPRQELYIEDGRFKVRSLLDEQGKPVQTATIGEAAEVMGFLHVPSVGSMLTEQKEDSAVTPSQQSAIASKPYSPMANAEELPIILVADSQGSLEAIIAALPEKVRLMSQKTGEITEADVLLAKSTGAFAIGFNTKVRPDVAKLARTEKVLMKNYTIIYELLDEIADVIEGKELAMIEQVYGAAKILARFPFEKTFALGISVLEGRVAKGDKARIMRGDEVIGETQVATLRVGKNATSRVEQGHEAGITISPILDFQVGDVLVFHE
jgi:translation initiation factor IF-2